MRIVVTQVTRMKDSRICVAGVDCDSGCDVRPEPRQGEPHLSVDDLDTRAGGLFGLGKVIDLGPVVPRSDPPHTEDRLYFRKEATAVQAMAGPEFWGLVQKRVKPSLSHCFGPSLSKSGKTCAMAKGTGEVSLGYLKLHGKAKIVPREDVKKAYLHWRCVSFGDLETALTDLRFFSVPDFDLKAPLLEEANRRLSAGAPAVLGLGLSRAFAGGDFKEKRHWLQINGLYFEEDFAAAISGTRLSAATLGRALFHGKG